MVDYIIDQLKHIISFEASFLLKFNTNPFLWNDVNYIDFQFYRNYITKLIEAQNKELENMDKSKSKSINNSSRNTHSAIAHNHFG